VPETCFDGCRREPGDAPSAVAALAGPFWEIAAPLPSAAWESD
jgi:hypothetical protein